jgi:ubiquitin C-terminal hydrolase
LNEATRFGRTSAVQENTSSPQSETFEYISTAPETMVVRLNRFHYSNGAAVKLNHPVSFMAGFTLQEGSLNSEGIPLKTLEVSYKPRGVIYHVGHSAQEGHYVYATFEKNGEVIVHNDRKVEKFEGISSDQELAESKIRDIARSAYLIFFEKVR